MFIALPDNMPEKPPILVNIHSCGNSAGGQWSYDGFAPLREAMDSVGFIMILPQQSRNCWNVGAPESLTHEGGGDVGAIVQMVKYALEEYNGDPTRVYVMGGSGGGMATQALLAVYPEVFKAGHARAGVAAGCWAEGYDDGQQWSDACAGGRVDKTPQEWGDFVRGINPSFTGPRPRLQLNQGNNDETINFNNFREAIEEWTNVLGLDEMPTSTDSGYQGGAASYDRQFWQDDCGYTVLEGWEALGMGHSMGYESVHILEWFGLDQVRDEDPWDAACGGMSVPEDDGAGGAGDDGAGGGAGADEPVDMGTGGVVGGAEGGGGDPAATDDGAGGVDPTGTADTPMGADVTDIDTPATPVAPAVGGGASPSDGAVGTPSTPAPPAAAAPNPGAGVAPVGAPTPASTPLGSVDGFVPTPSAGTAPSVAPAGAGAPVLAADGSGGGDDGGCAIAGHARRPFSSWGALLLVALGLALRRRRAK